MSFSRENVIWRSSKGGFYIGFFESFVVGDDQEWDVDYDFSKFQWASGPHKTEQEARESWRGANPGGHLFISEPNKETDCYDQMFKDYLNGQKDIQSTNWTAL
jgi:hypothetical protein